MRIARECRSIDERWYREQRRASMWMDLRQDVTYAVRTLRRAPSLTAVAVLTLALGIGATTAIFSLANWALLRPLPGVQKPDELLLVWSGMRRGEASFTPSRLSYPNLDDVSARLQSLSLAGMQRGIVNLSLGNAVARSAAATFVTPSYFDVLGVAMVAGRAIRDDEDRPGAASAVTVVSQSFAEASFGRVERALGQELRINSVPFIVVGVAGGGFAGTERMSATELWLPGAATPIVNHMPAMRYDDRKNGGFYEFIGRLRNGASSPQAAAELRSMTAWLAQTYPAENAKFTEVGFHVMGPIGTPALGGAARILSVLKVMFGASGLVLLIACSNVASLLMIRGLGRSGEVAVRQALGASRLRLLRQHLTEGIVLWMLGGGAALFIVWVLLRSADGVALLGQRGGGNEGVPVDWRVAAFALGLSVLVGWLFSFAPALRLSRLSVAERLREGAPSTSGRRLPVGAVLTVFQLALSLTLVVGALLLAATVRQLSRVDLGFEATHLYTFNVRPSSVGYSAQQTRQYRDEFARQLSLVPGVQRVALSTTAPFAGTTTSTRVKVDGTGEVLQPNTTGVMAPGYFETLGIPLVRGRLFSAEDLGVDGASPRPVVVVSELFARRLFGAGDPLGRTIEFNTIGQVGKRFEIIGVVGDTRFASLVADPEPMVYEVADGAYPGLTFVVRATDTSAAAGAVKRIAASLNPSLPVGLPMSMTAAIARARAEWDALARLVSALSAVAGLLAAVGLYGVIAFGVASRRREFGIRLALGAAPSRVAALVLKRAALITGFGLVLGAAGGVTLGRLLSSRLVGVTPFDPLVWCVAAVLLLVIALAASWIPARRAISVDVTRSLRTL
jgi:putative ABC transport system permease protein